MYNKILQIILVLQISLGSLSFANNYRADEIDKLNFLLKNVTSVTNMPKSFYVPEHYWEDVHTDIQNVENTNERILATYGQNIYDAATWQIALALMGKTEIATEQTLRLFSGESGDMKIKASSKDFQYGDSKRQFNADKAFFFRMISDQWSQLDPLTGETVNWMDWKPILGENAWAVLIGPLQVAYLKYNKHIPLDSIEVKLALSLLPAIKAMQSPIGGVYHATWGVWGKDPHDISVENNVSLYAGLKMLKQVLEDNKDKSTAISTIDNLLAGIDKFIQNYAYDKKEQIILQGGIYDPEKKQFIPSTDFAVDVQTWGLTVLGVKKIDKWFGKGTAYNIWQNTKKRGGFFKDDQLIGVGYTDDPSAVISVEWTLGAILLVKELNNYYHLPELEQEQASMRQSMENLKETVTFDGVETTAYDYADKRYFIPFGWWSNKIPSLTSTSWVIMNDRDFNPFILGGGKKAVID